MTRGNRGNHLTKPPLEGRTIMLALTVCMGLIRGVCAELVTTIPIAPEPVGSGARALGQSAFIAVADDATAASWNPAGLVNLEKPEASFVGIWKTIASDPSAASSNLSMNQDSWDETEINFMSYALPLEIGNRDAVLSVNYHQVYDLSVDYKQTVSKTVAQVYTADETTTGRWRGAISAWSLAGGVAIPSHPQVTVGASFNWYARSLCNDSVWHGTDRLRTVTDYPYGGPEPQTTTETLDNLRGYNFTFGLLWDAYERQQNLMTLGLVCHTPFTAEMDHELVVNGVRDPRPYRVDIDFPLSLGAGLNYRFSDRLSTAVDVQWTDWSDFNVRYTGGTTAPDDTLAFRWGGEYLTFFEGASQSVLAYRGGVFYEPRPAWDGTLPVYGFSLGLGWTVKERFSLDFAYQFRWGEADGFTVNDAEFDYGIQEHWFIGSVVVYFR